MRRVALFILLSAMLEPVPAGANGRRPTMVDVHFHPTDTDWILGAATFGMLLSTDGGDSFHWVCEEAACPGEGINGCDTFDPVYVITDDGSIFNTTIFGVHVSRDDGCTFTPVSGALMERFASDIDVGPNGDIWTMTSDGTIPNDVYYSTDNGVSFQTRNLHIDAGWFDSIRVAPSDGQRIYVSGYLPPQPSGDAGLGDATTLLYRSENGGQTWQQLPATGAPAGRKIALEVVSPTDPDLLIGRVSGVPDWGRETLYRSTDGGDTWAAVLELSVETANLTDPPGVIRVAARADGQTYVAGAPLDGLHVSTDFGATWTPAAVSPMTWCLRESGDGRMFACSENLDADLLLDPSVRAAMLQSSDAASWQKVLRFSEIKGPLQCPDGTNQREVCDKERWCDMAEVLGVDDPERCPGPTADAGTVEPPNEDCNGCGCSVAFASVIFVVPPGRRRRRRRG